MVTWCLRHLRMYVAFKSTVVVYVGVRVETVYGMSLGSGFGVGACNFPLGQMVSSTAALAARARPEGRGESQPTDFLFF